MNSRTDIASLTTVAICSATDTAVRCNSSARTLGAWSSRGWPTRARRHARRAQQRQRTVQPRRGLRGERGFAGDLGAHLARGARGHLGAFGGAPEPEQGVGGALGQRGEQVDLRSDDPGRTATRRALTVDHPDVLEHGRRPTLPGHRSGQSGRGPWHHRDPVGAGDEVQADDDLAGFERRTVAGQDRRAPERRRPVEALQVQRLPEAAGDVVEVRGDLRCLTECRPRRVGHADAAALRAPHETGDADARAGPRLERIELIVVHSTEQHVDGLQAVERTQPQPTFAHHQVGALDEVVAEVRRQVGLLHVAGERRPRCEQDAPRDCADPRARRPAGRGAGRRSAGRSGRRRRGEEHRAAVVRRRRARAARRRDRAGRR